MTLTHASAKEDLIENGAKINSIRRLFDNKEFTIGDYVKGEGSGYFKIQGFEPDESWVGGMKVMIDEQHAISINYIEHAKKPLLTTEDGVDIFEGDSYSFIEPYTFYAQASIAPNKNDWKHDTKRFSTKKKAEEWIENNKPRYSKKQILDAIYNVQKHGIINTALNSKSVFLLTKEDLFKELDL